MTTRRNFVTAAATAAAAAAAAAGHRTLVARPLHAARPAPTKAQLAWQRDELALFLHFGVNTFTNREWGDGHEDPAVFAPTALDARQWARSAASAGFRSMILTAKHHDGFCLWPTRTTSHSVASSGWRGGKGDVVREFVDACRAEGLHAGLYLSPWDRNARAYGDLPRYNAMYAAQLTELLTAYGSIHEVWFDGANGEGPNGKRQTYDWPGVWGLVRKLQPGAVIFSDAGPDVRWIGNENGAAGDPNWSTVDPSVVPYPGASGDQVIRTLQHGDPAGTAWRPGESDVSIRPGWFYHPAENAAVKSPDRLVDLYFSSVGRNSKLLLNVPPTNEGLLHANDVASLVTMRRQLDALMKDDIVARHHVRWKIAGNQGVATIDFDRPVLVATSDLGESIEDGQCVSTYRVEGWTGDSWQLLSRGTTIGYRKLDRFPAVACSRLRVTVKSMTAKARPVRVAAYSPSR
ncbi:MAG TPA: alpha-L-fucosidase [Gemmatimonadales bacterium]|jgi:alpha-L-fucosidase